jgi:amidase
MLEVFARWRERPKEITPTVMPAFLMGAYMHERHYGRLYAKAQSLLRRMRAEFDRILKDYDAMAMPTIPFRASAHPGSDATLKERVELALPMVGNTAPYNASGHPAISLPCGRHEDLPIGLMLVGPHFGEADLLSTAAAFEGL